MVLSSLLFGGCVILPAERKTYGTEISDADLAFIELGVTTISVVVERLVERLGEGYSFVSWDDNVLYYYWDVSDYVLVDLLPVSGPPNRGRQRYYIYIQFDSDDRAKKVGRLKGSFEAAQKEWRKHE